MVTDSDVLLSVVVPTDTEKYLGLKTVISVEVAISYGGDVIVNVVVNVSKAMLLVAV